MRKKLLLTAIMLATFCAREALGCVCSLEPNPTPEKIKAQRLNAFENASVVFSGEVVSRDTLTLKIKVHKLWKGTEATEITMLTGTTDNGDGTFTSSSCDYGFVKGEKYLVYAYGSAGELKTHACSRTTLLKYADIEMKGLDEITPHKIVGAEPQAGRRSRFQFGSDAAIHQAFANSPVTGVRF